MPTFREMATAAYCPRKLYYCRRASEEAPIPDSVAIRRELAFEYPRLLEAADLSAKPIAMRPAEYRAQLHKTKASLDHWDALIEPADRDVLLEGRDCRGVAHKILADPVAPSLVFTGEPPDTGVWQPQSVRLVAAALALAYEREREIDVAFAEYPTHGVVRQVSLSIHRRATYRSTLRTVQAIDGPPARVRNRKKCEPCEYRGDCGVRTRSLSSLI